MFANQKFNQLREGDGVLIIRGKVTEAVGKSAGAWGVQLSGVVDFHP